MMHILTPTMPNLTQRLPANIAGAYYVDASCTDCDLCRLNAPAFFSRDGELGYSIVHRQPVTPEEIELAEEALQGCPSESIGNDGMAERPLVVAARPDPA